MFSYSFRSARIEIMMSASTLFLAEIMLNVACHANSGDMRVKLSYCWTTCSVVSQDSMMTPNQAASVVERKEDVLLQHQ